MATGFGLRVRITEPGLSERANKKHLQIGDVFCIDAGVVLGFYAFYDSRKGLGVVDGELGKKFAVEFDILGLEAVDKLAVRNAVFAGSVVDTRNPECAEVAFFVTTIAVGVAKSLDDALFGKAKAAGAVVLHPLSGF